MEGLRPDRRKTPRPCCLKAPIARIMSIKDARFALADSAHPLKDGPRFVAEPKAKMGLHGASQAADFASNRRLLWAGCDEGTQSTMLARFWCIPSAMARTSRRQETVRRGRACTARRKTALRLQAAHAARIRSNGKRLEAVIRCADCEGREWAGHVDLDMPRTERCFTTQHG